VLQRVATRSWRIPAFNTTYLPHSAQVTAVAAPLSASPSSLTPSKEKKKKEKKKKKTS